MPEYQRLFQADNGLPTWMRTSRSRWMVYPYYALFTVGLTGALYGLTRLARGKK